MDVLGDGIFSILRETDRLMTTLRLIGDWQQEFGLLSRGAKNGEELVGDGKGPPSGNGRKVTLICANN